MKALIAAVLLTPAPAQAVPLECDINTPATYAQGTVPILINVELGSGKIEFHTLTEAVDGVVAVSEAEFRGWVTGTSGRRYWLSIDRYLGALTLTREGLISGQKADMWGECRAAKQKF
ncbi:hypothetical protein [Stenotrophomonas bentonitica]|uniref:hypothetical protein n=1 Tax=Stenotrophomonas bentonitica TaxID=1450134 RepID=UPI00345E1BEF